MPRPRLSFDHFEIQRDANGEPMELNSAGQGLTYRATDERLRKTVALKIIDPGLVEDQNSRRRFFNEARAAAAIEHPNVARVLYLCREDAPQCFYAMELVEGEPLARRIAAKGPFAPEAAFQTLRPIADALVALSQQNLIHRDLHSANIMLTDAPDGTPTVKLLDFGFVKSLAAEPTLLDSVQTSELRSSSVYHLSPEQIQRDRPIDARTDFYSLGITLWEALVGHPPFTGPAFEVHEAHLHLELPWSELPPLPHAAASLLRRMLAKNPEQRPADARQLLGLWDAALAGFNAKTIRSVIIGRGNAAEMPQATLPPEPAPLPEAAPPPEGSADSTPPVVSHGEVLAKSAPAPLEDSLELDSACTVALAINERTKRDIAPPARATPVTPARPVTTGALAVRTPPQSPQDWRVFLDMPAVRWGIAAAVALVLLVGGLLMFSLMRRAAPVRTLAGRSTPPAAGEALAQEARAALESGKLDVAEARMKALEALDSRHRALPVLQALLRDRHAEARKINSAATPAPPTPLSRIAGASKEQPFFNSLGTKLVPVPITGGRSGGRTVLFSVYETRVREFQRFVTVEGAWAKEDFQDSGDHPAVRVRAIDAVTFCQWLTKLERKAGTLPDGWFYQLPTDHEWSCAAGLGETEDASQAARAKAAPPSPPAAELAFPWGALWPPRAPVGNFADVELRQWNRSLPAIAGYDDRHPFTSPVGRFPPTVHGLHDLAGNAAEWCEDYQGNSAPIYVLRGGHWGSSERSQLASTARLIVSPEEVSEHYGFRVVLSQLKPRPYPRSEPPGGSTRSGP